MDDHLSNDRFLTVLRARRTRRANFLSSILPEPDSPSQRRQYTPLREPKRQRPSKSSEPSNLATHYLFTSSRPQNEIQNPYPDCFEGYPKLQRFSPSNPPKTSPSHFAHPANSFVRLRDLKKALVHHRSHPPISLRINWTQDSLLQKLSSPLLPTPIPPAQGLRFDVIVISESGGRSHFTDLTHLASLPIDQLAATPGFLFLWLPSSDALEVGRALLQRWGFRRAEDIVWVKTNCGEVERWREGGGGVGRRRRIGDCGDAVFARTKEHCLMGIRGTVRRSVPPQYTSQSTSPPLFPATSCAFEESYGWLILFG